jgi:hypothetical protein
MKAIFLATIILFSLIAHSSLAIGEDTGIGTDVPEGSLTCSGPWTQLICVIKQVSDIIKSIQEISNSISNWVPHSFPFGGPILSSERACQFKFDSWTRIPNPLCLIGICTPPTIAIGPVPISWNLGGRAIEVGPPVPSDGKIIAFPWISKIYDNHTENRKGPWSLGLGFTPFPLDEINRSLSSLRIWIPPDAINPPCDTIYAKLFLPLAGVEECLDNFRFECLASGEKDSSGNDVYKVIRLLGTSQEDVPAETLQELRNSFPSFPWP